MLAAVLVWQTMLPPWVGEAAIAAILRYGGITVRNANSVPVSGTDPKAIGTLGELR